MDFLNHRINVKAGLRNNSLVNQADSILPIMMTRINQKDWQSRANTWTVGLSQSFSYIIECNLVYTSLFYFLFRDPWVAYENKNCGRF